MTRSNGRLLCSACDKEKTWDEGARFCAYCGCEYSVDVYNFAFQDSKRSAYIRKQVLIAVGLWFFVVYLFPGPNAIRNVLLKLSVGESFVVPVILGSLLLVAIITNFVAKYCYKKLYSLESQEPK